MGPLLVVNGAITPRNGITWVTRVSLHLYKWSEISPLLTGFRGPFLCQPTSLAKAKRMSQDVEPLGLFHPSEVGGITAVFLSVSFWCYEFPHHFPNLRGWVPAVSFRGRRRILNSWALQICGPSLTWDTQNHHSSAGICRCFVRLYPSHLVWMG